MSKIYNKHIDRAVRTIDSVQPTFGQEKTEKFKKKLKIKKLEKELGKTPVKHYYAPKDFNKGGRVGLKSGTNPFARKSSLQKIQETFGPKQVKKKEKPKVRMQAKKGSKPKKKFPDLTGDGKVTFADVLKGRGIINGKKKSKKKVV